MALITPTRLASDDDRMLRYQWAGATSSADTFDPVYLPSHPDKAFQTVGIESTGQCALHGSLDGTNFTALTDPQGNALILSTGNAIEQVEQNIPYVKPVPIAGSPGTLLLAASR